MQSTREAAMKAKLLRAAGKIEDGADVEIVSRADETGKRKKKNATKDDAKRAASPAYAVRDKAGNQESVATQDFKIVR